MTRVQVAGLAGAASTASLSLKDRRGVRSHPRRERPGATLVFGQRREPVPELLRGKARQAFLNLVLCLADEHAFGEEDASIEGSPQ